MMNKKEYERQAGFAVKFALAGLVGFAIDAGLLHLGLTLGLSAAAARAISILSAMQVTFLINGLVIFKCVTLRNGARHWAGYMVSSGFGNFCSYMIFITLTSLHGSIVSKAWIAFPASTFAAYSINFAGARFLVFGASVRARLSRKIARGETRPAEVV
jgi:putative flippase GtrA